MHDADDLRATVTSDPQRWAAALSVGRDAVDRYRECDVIDLHLDSFIWSRMVGYRLARRHHRAPTGRHFAGQVDLPRALGAGLTGAQWSITTNPFRSAGGRAGALRANLPKLRRELVAHPEVELVSSVAAYRAARSRGRHGAFPAIQGGNALSASPEVVDEAIAGGIVRVTLVHLTSSDLGTTSSPLGRASRRAPLGARGREVVAQLEAGRVLVDLAHASPEGFWQVVEVHDRSLPLIVTHTGVDGVHPHWRNLDDDQIRAIADSGGCIGVMLQESFLGPGADVATVVDHLAHLVAVGGEAVPALGSDYDGMVTPPRDLTRHDRWPRLVAEMARRGWSDHRIAGVLGANALRTMEAARG